MADRRLGVVYADDEPIARRGIDLLLRAEPDVDVLAACRNGTEALEAIRAKRPDIAFLDVAMPALTGIEVVRALSISERPAIVFVTAFDRFAIEAFDLHAVDYLLKPFDGDRFRTALARARARLGGQEPAASRLDALLDAFDRRNAAPARLTVKEGDRIMFVPVEDVDWCEACDNYIKLHLGARTHLIRTTMLALERQLENRQFARIHRSAIVNLARVRELRPLFHGEYQVLLHDGTRLTMSRSYREAVLRRMGGP